MAKKVELTKEQKAEQKAALKASVAKLKEAVRELKKCSFTIIPNGIAPNGDSKGILFVTNEDDIAVAEISVRA